MNEKKYDFVLFENLIGAINHYKDILIIAKMLKFAGYNVAILNYCEESNYCKNEEFPIIEIKNKFKQPDVSWTTRPMSKFKRIYYVMKFAIEQHLYLNYFLGKTKGIAKNYYLGSYHLEMSSLLFTKSSSECNYFFWGLRSSRMLNFKSKLIKSPVLAYKALIFRNLFYKNKNFNFFISNELIRKEFIELGIDRKRLIMRAERIIDKPVQLNYHLISDKFSMLSIGLLRENKRIEFIIDAFGRLNDMNIIYTIAGRTNTKYEELIQNKIKVIQNKSNINRINNFIEEDEYKSLIERSHFVILCDKQQESLVTNGTMMEALILNRPIIAPDYLPYSYYINKYNIGLLFYPDDENSLKTQILKAKELGVKSFIPGLKKIQTTLLFDTIVNEFADDLMNSLNKN